MKLIRNYFLREWLGPILFSIFVFTLVLVMGKLVKLVDAVMNKGVPIEEVIRLFFYSIPLSFCYTIPMGALTGTLLAFGRFSSDNEIIALRAMGISVYRLIMPLVCFGLLLSTTSLIINDSIVPRSHYAAQQIAKNIGLKNPTAYLDAGTFIKAFKKYIVFIYEIDGPLLKGITIYEPQDNAPTRTIVAQDGIITAQQEQKKIRLELHNGTSDETHPTDTSKFYKLNFKKYTINLDVSEAYQKRSVTKKPMDMSLKELKKEIKEFKAAEIPPYPYQIELHRKFSLALASTIFIIIGFSLAVMARRKEKIFGFGISLAIIVMYYILLASGKALALKGILHPATGMWLPDGIMLVCGLLLLRHSNYH